MKLNFRKGKNVQYFMKNYDGDSDSYHFKSQIDPIK
jgi:hypothetical protein